MASLTEQRNRAPFWVAAALVALGVGWMLLSGGSWQAAGDNLSTFTTVFLGIFIEAAPFLLLGTLASGVVEMFVNKQDLLMLMPKNPFVGALMGGVMGLFFPVCECGVVPFTRRLFRKGMPLSVGISFLLAAPVLNPIVIVSTIAAYGFGPMVVLRIVVSLLIATITGLIFATQADPTKLIRPLTIPSAPVGFGGGGEVPEDDDLPATLSVEDLREVPGLELEVSLWQKIQGALTIAVDEFFEMGRYLILGAGLAALMQTFISQNFLTSLNENVLVATLALMALAVVLSICSTVDAFVSLAFVGTFGTGPILGFLVFGPMVDIKSTLMYLRVFNRRTVVYIILLPMLMTILTSVFIAYNTPY